MSNTVGKIKRNILAGVSVIALLCSSAVEAQQPVPIQLNATSITASSGGVPAMFVPGAALVGGPVAPAFTVNGSIVVTTIGSVTLGVLNINPPAAASPAALPIGSLITGSGVTAGTVVTAQLGTSSYAVQAQGGTIAAVSNITLTVTPKLATNIQPIIATTAPTYASGGCTAGSPAIAAGSTIWNWTFTNGTGTCTLNTVTFTLPAAPVSWTCQAASTLNPTTDFYVSTGAASTTAVVFTDYSSVGVAQPTKANDVITGSCLPR